MAPDKHCFLPAWAERGKTQFHNRHGGPAEVAKNVLSWMALRDHSFDDLMKNGNLFSAKLTPDVIWGWTNAYTEKFLDELADIGIGLLQVTWSCGFSLESESRQRDILVEFIEKAHARNIRICAYLSLTNIFWKDAFSQKPELEQIVARHTDGSPVLYGYCEARYLACVNQPAWLEHLKEPMRLALTVGNADAVYFDNLSANCVCDTCNQLFQSFTNDFAGKPFAPPESLPLRFTHEQEDREIEVHLATEQNLSRSVEADERSRDYLWRRFQAHQITEILKQLREEAVKIKPDIAFSANNHLLPEVNNVCNVIYSQDTRLPGAEWDNIYWLRYLGAESEGWKPVVTNHPCPEGHDPRLSIAEALAFGSFPYGITYVPYNHFFRDNPDLFTGLQPIADLAVIAEYPRRHFRYLDDLGRGNILYHVLLPGQVTAEKLSAYAAVLVADLEAMTEALRTALNEYERSGGIVLLSGASGCFDACAYPHPDAPSGEREEVVPDTKLDSNILGRIKAVAAPQVLEVKAPDGVVANLFSKADNSGYVLHMINYLEEKATDISLRVCVNGQPCQDACLYSPDMGDYSVSLEANSDGWLLIPELEIYSILKF